MNTWLAIGVAALAVYSWKFIGTLVPARFLESKRLLQISQFLTIALLTSLVGVQTFTGGKGIEFDARIVAIVIAGICLKLKVPFIGVVLIAAVTAALVRLIF